MPAPPADRSLSEDDLAVLLTRFAEPGAEAGMDRLALRRSVRDAAEAWPGDIGQRWWKWTVESGRSAGLRMRVLEVPLMHAWELARAGAVFATYAATTRQLVILSEARTWRARVECIGGPPTRQRMTRKRLGDLLAIDSPSATLRWVTVEPLDSADSLPHRDDHGHRHGDHGHGHGASPWARLWQLLRPEWSDILVILVFAVCIGMLLLATPIAVESLVNTVAFGRLLQPVIVLAIALMTFLAFAAALLALQTFVVELIQRRLFARVAGDLAWRFPRVRHEVHDGIYGPELVNRFFDVVTLQKAVAQLLLDGITLILGTVIGMALLAFYHPFLLGYDIVLLLAMGFIIHILGRGAIQTSIRESVAKYRVADWLEELIRCRTAFKAAGGLDLALERIDHLTLDYLESRRRHFHILMRQIVFALILQAIASAVLLGLGGWLVILGQLTLGQLVAAELIVAVIVGTFAKLGKHFDSFYDLMAAIDKLGMLFDLPLETEHGVAHVPAAQGPATMRLWRVKFAYPGQQPLFNDLTVTVERGERLAIVGSSSSGKSTLLDLMYGLRRPQGGHIELNGVDLRDLRPEQLRRHSALVRDAEIFAGTMAENVHLGRQDVTSEDVHEALVQVDLLDHALSLPNGLNTRLHSGGAPLSPCQARRLTLARALAGRPRLVLIDGLLDQLPDDVLARIFPRLAEWNRRHTLVIATGQRRVADLCTRVFRLDDRQPGPAAGAAGTRLHITR